MTPRIKFNNITHLADARFAAGVGAEWLSFSCSIEDTSFIDPQVINEINGWIQGISPVLYFKSINKEWIEEVLSETKIYSIEVDGFLEQLPELSFPIEQFFARTNLQEVIKMGSIEIEALPHPNYYFVVEGEDKDLEYLLDTPNLDNIAWDRIIWNLPFTPENISSFLERFPVYGVEFTGEKESKPGYRNFDNLIDVIDVIAPL